MYAMFRNTINISQPTRGWGQTPDANDIREADDIERIRIYHKKISHENSSRMVNMAIFNDLIKFESQNMRYKLDTEFEILCYVNKSRILIL